MASRVPSGVYLRSAARPLRVLIVRGAVVRVLPAKPVLFDSGQPEIERSDDPYGDHVLGAEQFVGADHEAVGPDGCRAVGGGEPYQDSDVWSTDRELAVENEQGELAVSGPDMVFLIPPARGAAPVWSDRFVVRTNKLFSAEDVIATGRRCAQSPAGRCANKTGFTGRTRTTAPRTIVCEDVQRSQDAPDGTLGDPGLRARAAARSPGTRSRAPVSRWCATCICDSRARRSDGPDHAVQRRFGRSPSRQSCRRT